MRQESLQRADLPFKVLGKGPSRHCSGFPRVPARPGDLTAVTLPWLASEACGENLCGLKDDSNYLPACSLHAHSLFQRNGNSKFRVIAKQTTVIVDGRLPTATHRTGQMHLLSVSVHSSDVQELREGNAGSAVGHFSTH